MALTIGGGPLISRPLETVNFRIDGPAHRLFWHDFPRRVRALFAGETVLDSDGGANNGPKLLHESNLLPQLYVPRRDVAEELLEATDHESHCPFKGDAAYYSVRVGDRVADNAVWTYPKPTDDAGWLAGYVAVYWNSMDAWFDEGEEVFGHIRDPYHRVDVREATRHVRVVAGDEVIAESMRPKLLSETGLPNRFYLPESDVRAELLEPSAKHTVCPYKGTASYRGVRTSSGVIPEAVWTYPDPLEDARKITGHLCLLADGLQTWVDGEQVA